MYCLTCSTSAFFNPDSSAISISQAPCSCSNDSLPWNVENVSENQAIPNRLKNVDLYVPCGPTKTNTISYLVPGLNTRATAAHNAFLIEALVYSESSAPK